MRLHGCHRAAAHDLNDLLGVGDGARAVHHSHSVAVDDALAHKDGDLGQHRPERGRRGIGGHGEATSK